MGRKSKKSGKGKSKSGGKQRSATCGNNIAQTPTIDTADGGPNIDTSPKDVNNTMKLLEDGMKIFEAGMEVLRGGNKEKALKLKAERDKIVEKMKLQHLEEVDEDQKNLAQLTLQMAQCGLVEEENHSSIVYAEEHADVLFDDGGEQFFKMWKVAAGNAALEKEKRKELERLVNDGNILDMTAILSDVMLRVEMAQNERRIEQGPPSIQYESSLHFTKFDEELFQPRSKSDCPICFLPMPRRHECCYMPCCGKVSDIVL